MKLLITGGAGFIGSQIANLALSKGHDVTVLDSMVHGDLSRLHRAIPLRTMDIRDPDLDALLRQLRPEAVIHQAAQISVPGSIRSPLEDLSINAAGTVNLLEACVRNGVRKIIYPSTAAVFSKAGHLPIREDDPFRFQSPYAVSKQVVEHYLQVYQHLHGLAWTILRYANVYGPGQDPRGEGGVAAIFMDAMVRGQTPVIHGDGHTTRDFVYSGDCARVNLMALDDLDGEILHVGTGIETSILELYDLIAGLTGHTSPPVFAPERPGDIRRSCLSPEKLIRRTGLNLTPLARGLELTLSKES